MKELNIRTTLWGKFKPNKKTGEVEFVRFRLAGELIYGATARDLTAIRSSASFRARPRRLGTLSPSLRGFLWSSGRFVFPRSFLAFWPSGLSLGCLKTSECRPPAWSRPG